MYDDEYLSGDEEADAARDRIDRIRRGGAAPSPSEQPVYDDALGDVESDALSRARSRARVAREVLGTEEPEPVGRGRTPATRGRQGLLMILGIVAIGVLVVVVIVLASQFLKGEGGGFTLPFMATDTPTPTATSTPTETPLPTETATPTKEAPKLALPPLTCIFQSGTGCYDYCQDEGNASECDSAKDFVRAQGADPDAWFECLSPGPGPNEGNPQQCLEDAWRAANP
jgi:hypothetical protein